MSSIKPKIAPTTIIMLAIITISMNAATAAPTPEQKCEAGRNNAAGKLVACLAKAEKGVVISGDPTTYSEARAKCDGKFATAWSKLEAAAIDAGTMCPSGDQTAIADFLDACVQSVAAGVGGGSLGMDPVTCESELAICEGDLSDCYADVLAAEADVVACEDDVILCEGNTITCGDDLTTCQGNLAACEATPSVGLMRTGQTLCHNGSNVVTPCAGTGQDGDLLRGAARTFTDNGDGTITDHATGLMWEKQSDAGGIHDVDTAYNWSQAFGKVATLNSSSFAGYSDWRLPNIVELESLKNFGAFNPAAFPAFQNLCGNGCSNCSCTYAGLPYWSSTTAPGSPSTAFHVAFNAGDTALTAKSNFRLVRAVRGGS